MKYFFYTIFLLFSLNLFSQTVNVKYYVNNTNGSSNYKSLPDYNWFTYNLIYSNGKMTFKSNDFSKYLNKSYTIVDTLKSENKISHVNIVYTKEFLKVKESNLFKDYNTTNFIDVRNIYGDAIAIEDNFIINNYELTLDTKQILGYNCKKAIVTIGNKKDIYWFTDELGIVANPNLIESVPGLVLEIESDYNNYLAYEISIKDVNTVINKPSLEIPYLSLEKAMDLQKSKQEAYIKRISGNSKVKVENR